MDRMTTLLVVTVMVAVGEAEHGFLGEAGEAQSRTFPALLPHQVNWDYDQNLKQDYLFGYADDLKQNVTTQFSVSNSAEAAAAKFPAAAAGIPAAKEAVPAAKASFSAE